MAIRLYELAKRLGVSSRELIDLLRKRGRSLSDSAKITPEIARLAEKLVKASVQPTEVKRVLKGGTIHRESMTVATIAEKAGVPISDVIVTLLKKGIVATINQLLPEETVVDLAKVYELTVIEKPQAETEEIEAISEEQAGEWKERLPVVVIIGHVDHGKTTLLDFIRKTRVASREKGGITQHLGAYEVPTSHGSIVFLDTPGHEAFSLIRVRGVKVADIAIVIIAADDGIKPQTVEAITAAKNADIPIIIAINKIDKATPAQIETLKGQLAKYELVPEEWGGETIVANISAKEGTGVDELLEVLVLQAQLMDLKANMTIPARGYVLESHLEKGRGPVATIICQHGTLKVGDYFAAGESTGRVSSLVNSEGKRIKEVGPSAPVTVAGLSKLVHAGDIFEVHSQKVLRKGVPTAQRADLLKRKAAQKGVADIDIIVKADNASSREAVVDALSRLTSEHGSVSIIQSSIGDVTESDVIFAEDTGALIYGFNIKVQPNAADLINKKNINVKTFDIIYKLIEEVEALLESRKPIQMITQKVGEAIVLKVFDIKNLGVIAGSIVKDGRFVRNGKVIVYRGKEKVGEGPIKSLQRERKVVKEVHTGFECGFLVDGFDGWEVDDRVECYQEIPAP